MGQRMIRIAGTMTSFGGDVHHVWLDVTLAQLPRTYGVDDAQIVDLGLASGTLCPPDGEYILEYFLKKPFHKNVLVKSGRLMI
jgi:hypothetical protein